MTTMVYEDAMLASSLMQMQLATCGLLQRLLKVQNRNCIWGLGESSLTLNWLSIYVKYQATMSSKGSIICYWILIDNSEQQQGVGS